MWKLPFDAFIIQNIIMDIKPDYIIETGTGCGGSSIFYASILELLNHGRVITVDSDDSKINFKEFPNINVLDRVTYIKGSSTDSNIINQISGMVNGFKTIVLLNS